VSDHSGCIVCGGPDDFEPTLRILARCRRCGFVTWRGQTAGAIDDLYDEHYFSGVDYPDYVGNEPALRRSMRRHLEQMRHFSAAAGTLLEVGCAYGFFLDEARKEFARVVGVDVAAGPVGRARERFHVETHAGSFLDLPFDAASFQAICMWDTVEHLPRPDLFVEKARRLLGPGGHLFLTTADISSLNARIRGAGWRQIHPPSHLHYFSRETMGRMLERLGFRVLGVETAAYYHSVHNVLGTLALRGGITGALSRPVLGMLGETMAKRLGFWANLGDIMFVAAEPRL
jgi:SAM-dependent methyltransferase